MALNIELVMIFVSHRYYVLEMIKNIPKVKLP